MLLVRVRQGKLQLGLSVSLIETMLMTDCVFVSARCWDPVGCVSSVALNSSQRRLSLRKEGLDFEMIFFFSVFKIRFLSPGRKTGVRVEIWQCVRAMKRPSWA